MSSSNYILLELKVKNNDLISKVDRLVEENKYLDLANANNQIRDQTIQNSTHRISRAIREFEDRLARSTIPYHAKLKDLILRSIRL